MTPADVLRAARERISTPERWTKGVYAIDSDGCAVDTSDRRACAWCALGALAASLPCRDPDILGMRTPLFDEARALLSAGVPRNAGVRSCHWSVSFWNDAPGRTHAEVLATFDRAIALAEAE